MKFCNCCLESKNLEEFSVSKNSKDGKQARCKKCFSVYMKQRNLEKGEKINQKRRLEYAEQIEKKRLQAKASYIKHAEKRRKAVSEYQSNPENKEKIARRQRNWKNKKIKTDPLFALKYRMSSLFRIALKAKGFGKTTKIAQTLGCTWNEFSVHIERQFLKGMTWENRHLWHIDHIIPLAVAKSEDDVIKLNHYTNLRPLWAKDNLLKSDKLESLL
jgi:hypothetical protein